MELENESIEVRIVSRQESSFCIFELTASHERNYNEIFDALKRNSASFKHAVLLRSMPRFSLKALEAQGMAPDENFKDDAKVYRLRYELSNLDDET